MLKYIKSGVSQSANLLIGGNKYGDKGYHVEPTVFADIQDDMDIAKDEIFGLMMSILKFSDIEEAVQRANDTDYGLTAAVFTEDISKALQVSNALRVGQIYVNCYGDPQPYTPFAGFKNSGVKRELGYHGLENYLEDKTVVIAKPEGSLPPRRQLKLLKKISQMFQLYLS